MGDPLRGARGGPGRIEFEAEEKIGREQQIPDGGSYGIFKIVFAPRAFELREKWLDSRQ